MCVLLLLLLLLLLSPLHASSSAVCTTLQVRYLRIAETDKGYNPHRWVRYITSSSSYVFRM